MIPFLEDWKENSLESTVEWVVDEHKCIQHIFVCPAYTDKVLSYMHPVILVDAAHLKSAYKGTIFIYTSLTGNDQAYILAFGISGGNKDYRTWNIFNRLFATACPSVSVVEDDMLYLKFVFVSDTDKGPDKSLWELFPQPNAYEYLENIPMEHSCNMQWIKTCKYQLGARLPPRYGVVTSSTSECINSMIEDYRSEGWTDLLEGVLQNMAEKISENRQWYRMVDGNDVVNKVKQVLKECFHAAAAMQVVELEVGQKYMVTETSIVS